MGFVHVGLDTLKSNGLNGRSEKPKRSTSVRTLGNPLPVLSRTNDRVRRRVFRHFRVGRRFISHEIPATADALHRKIRKLINTGKQIYPGRLLGDNHYEDGKLCNVLIVNARGLAEECTRAATAAFTGPCPCGRFHEDTRIPTKGCDDRPNLFAVSGIERTLRLR